MPCQLACDDDAVVPRYLPVQSDPFLDLMAEQSDPRRDGAGLLDAALQGALEVEQVPVEATLVGEVGENAGVVRGQRQGRLDGRLQCRTGLGFGELADEEAQAVGFCAAFEDSGKGERSKRNEGCVSRGLQCS